MYVDLMQYKYLFVYYIKISLLEAYGFFKTMSDLS